MMRFTFLSVYELLCKSNSIHGEANSYNKTRGPEVQDLRVFLNNLSFLLTIRFM